MITAPSKAVASCSRFCGSLPAEGHPTTHGHKVIGDAFANQLHLFKWI